MVVAEGGTEGSLSEGLELGASLGQVGCFTRDNLKRKATPATTKAQYSPPLSLTRRSPVPTIRKVRRYE